MLVVHLSVCTCIRRLALNAFVKVYIFLERQTSVTIYRIMEIPVKTI